MRSPAEFICYACSFLRYWAGLQDDQDKKMLEHGADQLQRIALERHAASQRPPGTGIAGLEDEDKMQEDDDGGEDKMRDEGN